MKKIIFVLISILSFLFVSCDNDKGEKGNVLMNTMWESREMAYKRERVLSIKFENTTMCRAFVYWKYFGVELSNTLDSAVPKIEDTIYSFDGKRVSSDLFEADLIGDSLRVQLGDATKNKTIYLHRAYTNLDEMIEWNADKSSSYH